MGEISWPLLNLENVLCLSAEPSGSFLRSCHKPQLPHPYLSQYEAKSLSCCDFSLSTVSEFRSSKASATSCVCRRPSRKRRDINLQLPSRHSPDHSLWYSVSVADSFLPSTAASCINYSGLVPHPWEGRWCYRECFYVTNVSFIHQDPVLLIPE